MAHKVVVTFGPIYGVLGFFISSFQLARPAVDYLRMVRDKCVLNPREVSVNVTAL